MSKLAEKLKRATPTPNRTNTSRVDLILAELKVNDKTAHAALLDALADVERVSNRELARLLTEAGHLIGSSSVGAYRLKRREAQHGPHQG